MNLFQKYGIKEVADVVFYSITSIGDEEVYTPVLYLDTLKISTLEKTAQTVTANGGKGNKKLISWNFGKEIKLNLEDALFSPASMSLLWGGKLENKLSPYTSAIIKINMANKYAKLHYSTKAYPSPALTDEEWEIIFKAAHIKKIIVKGDTDYLYKYWTENYNVSSEYAYYEEARTIFKKQYYNRIWNIYTENTETDPITYNSIETRIAVPDGIAEQILWFIDEIKKIGSVETQIYDLEVIDRMQRCIVRDPKGFTISTKQQRENLLKYYSNDETSSYEIYYDEKTMLPLLNISNSGTIVGWDNRRNSSTLPSDVNFDRISDDDKFKIRLGTPYLKWTRTVKRKSGENDGILGKTFVIDADTFPGNYKIVGETYIREYKTGKDQKYQFVINKAQVSTDTNITLQADGDPTTFSMSIDVLTPPNDVMIELKQFDVDEDLIHGGDHIVPQSSKYTHTQTETIRTIEQIDNEEIY